MRRRFKKFWVNHIYSDVRMQLAIAVSVVACFAISAVLGGLAASRVGTEVTAAVGISCCVVSFCVGKSLLRLVQLTYEWKRELEAETDLQSFFKDVVG